MKKSACASGVIGSIPRPKFIMCHLLAALARESEGVKDPDYPEDQLHLESINSRATAYRSCGPPTQCSHPSWRASGRTNPRDSSPHTHGSGHISCLTASRSTLAYGSGHISCLTASRSPMYGSGHISCLTASRSTRACGWLKNIQATVKITRPVVCQLVRYVVLTTTSNYSFGALHALVRRILTDPTGSGFYGGYPSQNPLPSGNFYRVMDCDECTCFAVQILLSVTKCDDGIEGTYRLPWNLYLGGCT
jgi:hypothetical protein